jgi:asparagine synthase (glutamine-hydrolysing)
MPGLTLTFCPFAAQEVTAQRFRDAQESMLHGPDFKSHVHFSRGSLMVGHVGYAEYPIRVFSTESHDVYLEGYIYSVPETALATEIADLSARLLGIGAGTAHIKHWIESHEGEYLIVLVSRRTDQLFILTDPLGRLPVYYYADSETLCVARECKFVTGFRRNWNFDRVGCAQVLWTGHPFRERTLFCDVRAAIPGILMEASHEHGKLRIGTAQLCRFSFECAEARQTIEQCTTELADVFLKATAQRAQSSPMNVISLSAGWDSRLVAAGVKQSGANCAAATFLCANGIGKRDLEIAPAIAAALNMPWYKFQPSPEGTDEERLVYWKDGLNYVLMSFNLPFMMQIISKWGRNAQFLTGDGGLVLKTKSLKRKVRSAEELIDEIALDRAIVPMRTAEDLFDLKPGTLADDLHSALQEYPESDWNLKGTHFLTFERCRRFTFEGEDRARFFMWQTAPLFAFPFFSKVMRAPERFKSGNRLYQRLQRLISPATACIADANTGIPPGSPLFACVARVKKLLLASHSLRQRLKPVFLPREFGRARIPASAYRYLEQLASNGAPERFMDPGAAQTLLLKANETQFANWWTLALLDQLVTNGQRATAKPF